jgi:hypothetical protein
MNMDMVIYNICNRICKIQISILDISIIFLLTVFVWLLWLLFVIRILGN